MKQLSPSIVCKDTVIFCYLFGDLYSVLVREQGEFLSLIFIFKKQKSRDLSFFILILFICAYNVWIISTPCPHSLP
jgi:hypothetical protein